MTSFNSDPDAGDPGGPGELHQLLTEHATDLLSLNDPDGRPVWASRSLERLRGRDSTLFENIHPDDLQVVRRWWQQILAGSAERLRWRLRTVAGEWHWLETSAALLTYRDRAYVLCSARDVTVEKQAHDALQESARKLTAAARLAHIGYWEDDILADRVSWSEEAAHVLGAPVTERTGTWKDFMQHVHQDDRQYVEERRGRLLRGDEAGYRATFRLLLPEGSVRQVETTAEAVRDEDGRTLRTVGAIQDVSGRTHVHELLRRDQDRFRLALQATGLGFWDWDGKTNIVTFLPAGKGLLGLDPNDIPSRYEAWVDRIHPEDRERVRTAARSCLEGGQPEFALEFRLRHEDGTDRWIYTSGVVVRDSTGRPAHLIGCHLNITERRQLEEQFRQAQKMEAVGRIAAGIAHDFNNVLTVIDGYAEFLAGALDPSHPSREDIGQIRAAVESGANLTRQLLAFSRRQVLQPQILDLNDVLRRVHSLLRRVTGEDITLALNLSASSRVSADPGQIEQVLMNLAVNARDAMPNGGQLTFETADVDLDDVFVAQHRGATTGKHVLVAISDTGSGMDELTRAHLFEPFFTTKPSGKGTGLGLATVYGIVKQSRGSIWVDSERGKGTTFKIYLPVATGAAEQPPAPVDVRALHGSETVLVVEDQPDVRGVIAKALGRYGYTVLTAANDADAIAMAQAHKGAIHLMLTDVVLPGASGREIARQVVATRPSLRVMYMSGYPGDVIVQRGVLEPGLAFIQKPFTAEVLTRRIREVLAANSPPVF